MDNTMEYKTCTKCGVEKEASTEFFYRYKLGKYGLRAECKICLKQHYEDHIQHVKEYDRKRYKENKESVKECTKQWAKANPDKVSSYSAKKRARKLNQTPSDANKEKIALIYKMCSTMDGYHVDHIKPLSKGGQHHENNLQILKASLNMEKHDKWPLTKEEHIKYKGRRL